ncbi:hypothetical protein JF50_10105 [Pseudoalteromonas luteoviolacea]|uniref:PsbP C-terminal domain-containing protein n=1 Tax=Pseudoalteromonas luteoviolacea TaxID=43657 RepID=A0A0C1MKG0_9GAMM|nr:hypothetical protein [Pseudoalteromonas luteoviolacea]KID57534.1 hypothetical protein JF50_10105 [Pseudoalteromonas luteoviolacea]
MKHIALALFLLTLTSCAAFKLVKPQSATVHGITLTPTSSWNKVNGNPHKKSQLWTKDGLALNELYIIGNIANGETIFKSSNKELPLPSFKAGMLPNELEEFVKTSLKNSHGGSINVNTESMAPQMIGEDVGFRMELSYFLEGGLKKSVDALVAVKNDKLYMVMYISPSLHYAERYKAEVNSIFGSVSVL